MVDLAEDADGLPTICGSEERLRQAMQASRTTPVFLPQGTRGFGEITSAFAIALHMHQPLIPTGGPELPTAQLISNVQWMLENPDSGDNCNARVFLWCYQRMGQFVPHLLDEGFQPRVMLEYSGMLLYGLRQMGAADVLDALARLTGDERTRWAVEWLGCPWGHAVAPSTPVQDYLCWLHESSAEKIEGLISSVTSSFDASQASKAKS
jgi:hypothetical protein